MRGAADRENEWVVDHSYRNRKVRLKPRSPESRSCLRGDAVQPNPFVHLRYSTAEAFARTRQLCVTGMDIAGQRGPTSHATGAMRGTTMVHETSPTIAIVMASAKADEKRPVRWIRIELALVLAEATGRRIGAIRQLRWEDIDYTKPAITWRADADKMGVLWTIDLQTPLVAELRHFLARLRGVGGWVFPAARLPDQTMDRWVMVRWLLEAERDAKLPKLVGGVWHPYRRKWAMERKHWPIRDVAAVGGWKNVRSLLECYAQADRDTMRAVVNEPRKLLSTDLHPSQLATQEPWSPDAGKRHDRRVRMLRRIRGQASRRRCSIPARPTRHVGARVAPMAAKVAPPPSN
jgi:integrase